MPKELGAVNRKTSKKNMQRLGSAGAGGVAQECKHVLRVGSLCALCGRELARDEQLVPALHSSDKLLQTAEAAEALQKESNGKLRSDGKMMLIIDLDQTILHTTVEKCECDFKFISDTQSFYVKLRPHLQKFLRTASKLFEMHIYTMGTREYARVICEHIDPKEKYFGNRIVTRSENFNELKKSIGRITCITKNVIILDDRADVWEYSANLVLIRPFWYHDRIDINDPSVMLPCCANDGGVLCGGSDSDDKGCAVAEEYPSRSVEDVKEAVPIECSNNLGETHEEQSFCGETGAKRYLRVFPSVKKTKLAGDSEALQDNDLLRVLRTLKSVHKRFFEANRHVKKLLRLKFFRKIRIASHPRHYSLVRFSGAVLSFDNPRYVVEEEELARRFKTINVQVQWLSECIYRRRLVDVGNYVISDHRVVDEYQKELEDEFFNL